MPAFTATNTTAQTSGTAQRYARDIVIDGTVVRPYEAYGFDEFTSDILTAMDEDTVSVVHLNGPFTLADLPKIGLELVRQTGLVRIFGVAGQTHREQTVLSVEPVGGKDDADEPKKKASAPAKPVASEPVNDDTQDDEPANSPAHAEPADMVADEVDEPQSDAAETTETEADSAPEPETASEPEPETASEDESDDAPGDEPAFTAPSHELHWKTAIGIIEKTESDAALVGFVGESETRHAVLKVWDARFPA